ncbi:Cation diffusion facilitator family transporter [Desulfamplus magnetovallimortis]|uniref:Cation diffusion facilitator family transporter n=1 Tax=Desulfamplus magnetovallimortis TaxID=1246637 RepID=A0A1W1H8S1_9BACT|nr:cation diffusion facilitator family transporter [Desulfamplus magnetovallimortis]SLM28890.1 Cation diffusion facilitator family transporter [Desulfamplus magnetovallimortis]
MLAVNVGLAANIVLALLKTIIGIAGKSPALLADGINSTSDVAYGIVVNIFMRLSAKPADHEHPYGHEQMETIAAVVVGAFVMTTAIAIFWNSINSVYEMFTLEGSSEGAASMAMWVAIFTVALKAGLTIWTKKVGEITKNSAVMALASDHRNDVFASLAATVGIFFGRMGFAWVDPLAGAAVSLIILHTGIEILRSSAGELMDTVPGRKIAEQIRSLLDDIPGIKAVEEIKAHRFGPYMVVNITIGVDGSISVTEGDEIATEVEETLMEKMELMRQVHVHYHPAN